jgi:hypothetical protein
LFVIATPPFIASLITIYREIWPVAPPTLPAIPVTTADLEFGFTGAAGFPYETGAIVNGVEWKETYGRTLFILANRSEEAPLLDLMVDIKLPFPVILVEKDNQVGCLDLDVSQRHHEAAIPGESGRLKPISSYTNTFCISCPRVAPKGSMTVSLVYSDNGIRSRGLISMSYRYIGENVEPTNLSYLIVAEGNTPRVLRVDTNAPPPTEGQLGFTFGPP